jgi:predicted TIM-barrel fold metal-dependent hydrolase
MAKTAKIPKIIWLMIIDCHTHAYPVELSAAPRAWALSNSETHWASLVAPTDRPSIQGWSDLNSMLAAMDAAGVQKAALLGWYWEHESTCRWHNAEMAKWLQTAPDRLLGFASIYPNAHVIDQLESAQELGFRGVGELHMGVQNFSASNPHWQAMAQWCSEHGWPINCHATETAGHEHPGSVPTPLQEFVRMAIAAPNLKLILAHWGGGLAFFEQNPKLHKALKNVYYDSAASPLLYDMSVFKQMVNLVGIDKLLFGSDYPLRIYPRTQKQAEMQRFIDNIQNKSGLTTSELSKLLGHNFTKLMARD